jgi:hypothetical protein
MAGIPNCSSNSLARSASVTSSTAFSRPPQGQTMTSMSYIFLSNVAQSNLHRLLVHRDTREEAAIAINKAGLAAAVAEAERWGCSGAGIRGGRLYVISLRGVCLPLAEVIEDENDRRESQGQYPSYRANTRYRKLQRLA